MKLCLRVVLTALSTLSAVACGGATNDASTDDANATSAKTYKLSCEVDTPRLGQYDHNAFAAIDMELKGQNVKITAVAYTTDFKVNLANEIKNEQDYLAKGVEYDGKTPLTAADRQQANDRIAQVNAILAAEGKLVFEGKIKPYVRQPKVPTVQYPLDPKTAGIDTSTLWDELGNEGDGGRLLLPPSMSNGSPGKPDIEWDGTQGPLWDRYDCR
jgi:hypothetical protein